VAYTARGEWTVFFYPEKNIFCPKNCKNVSLLSQFVFFAITLNIPAQSVSQCSDFVGTPILIFFLKPLAKFFLLYPIPKYFLKATKLCGQF
jgi:ABC-type Co2+ transport system permease subunit